MPIRYLLNIFTNCRGTETWKYMPGCQKIFIIKVVVESGTMVTRRGIWTAVGRNLSAIFYTTAPHPGQDKCGVWEFLEDNPFCLQGRVSRRRIKHEFSHRLREAAACEPHIIRSLCWLKREWRVTIDFFREQSEIVAEFLKRVYQEPTSQQLMPKSSL